MANGWTPERREKQAAAIHTWKPWRLSTGPITKSGKESSSNNAFIFGDYGQVAKADRKRVADVIRECRQLNQQTK